MRAIRLALVGGALAAGALAAVLLNRPGKIEQVFAAVGRPMNPAVDVTAALSGVVPAGSPLAGAEGKLKAEGFTCAAEGGGGTRCFRRVADFPCEDTWIVNLSSPDGQTVSALRGTAASTCD